MNFTKIKCDKCHNEYSDSQIRKCPHEAVAKRYGKNICYYCCKKCKNSYFIPMTGVLGCKVCDAMPHEEEPKKAKKATKKKKS